MDRYEWTDEGSGRRWGAVRNSGLPTLTQFFGASLGWQPEGSPEAALEILALAEAVRAAEQRGHQEQREADAALVRSRECICDELEEAFWAKPALHEEPRIQREDIGPGLRGAVIIHDDRCPIALADFLLEGKP